MKSIVTVNTDIPGISDSYNYNSGQSLHDHDIVVFDPTLPYYYNDIHFSSGASAIGINEGKQALANITHWKTELTGILKDGKTVFFLLGPHLEETYATGTTPSKTRTITYTTAMLTNYAVLPFPVKVINSKGSKIKIVDSRFRTLFDALKEHIAYEVYLDMEQKTPIATTASGNKVLSTVYQLKGHPGHLVLLPYFNLSDLADSDSEGNDVWTKEALGIGTKLIKALVELDKVLTQQSDRTPQPEWVDNISKSGYIKKLGSEIEKIDQAIIEKEKARVKKHSELEDALNPTALLYETGKPLERAIESALMQLGYNVSTFREGPLEIDHVIISPGGKRLIGEAEGKDNTAISIDKFRQLETNINEDFQREEVTEPALGVLFGNGYRLKDPANRGTQFTDKCLINAKRLSTVLIQTSDLFAIAMYLQDNPGDEDYKKECRKIIESASGKVAHFPSITTQKEE